jgi:hypothetical protein
MIISVVEPEDFDPFQRPVQWLDGRKRAVYVVGIHGAVAVPKVVRKSRPKPRRRGSIIRCIFSWVLSRL